VLKDPIDYEAASRANELYKEYCKKILMCNNDGKIPEPIHKAMCDMAVFRYTLSCTGHIEVLLNPGINKPRDIECFVKATMASIRALAKSYPEYQDVLTIQKREITKLFDNAKFKGNRIMSGRRTKDLIADVFALRKNNDEMNNEVWALFQRVDEQFGTCYMPSNELVKAEWAASRELRAMLVDMAEKHSIGRISAPQPMAATITSDMSFMDIIIEQDTRTFSEKTYMKMRARARGERKELNRSTMLGLQYGSIENTALSAESKKALIALCANRHTFHASAFAKLFLHPEYNNIASVNGLISCVEQLKKDPNLPEFPYDVQDCILEMREIAMDVKEKEYKEPYFLSGFNAFDEKKEELDAAIMEYTRAVDAAYDLKLTPKGLSREGRNMYYKGLNIIQGMMKTEQKRKERETLQTER
jgi:hypothetical protein